MKSIPYSIEHHPHGISINGAVPTSELCALIDAWKLLGYTHFDALIAKRIHRSFVIVSESGMAEWRKELGIDVSDRATASISNR